MELRCAALGTSNERSAIRGTVEYGNWHEGEGSEGNGLLRSAFRGTVEYGNLHEGEGWDCRGVPLEGLSNMEIGM